MDLKRRVLNKRREREYVSVCIKRKKEENKRMKKLIHSEKERVQKSSKLEIQ